MKIYKMQTFPGTQAFWTSWKKSIHWYMRKWILKSSHQHLLVEALKITAFMWLVVNMYFCEQDCLDRRERDYFFKLTNFTVLGSQQNWGASTRFPYTPCPHIRTASSTVDCPHQRDTFVTIDEPVLTYHCHQRCTQGVHSTDLGKFVMTYSPL